MGDALQVNVLPSGFEDYKDLLGFVVSMLNLLVTAAIPLLIWWFDRQQAKRQDVLAAQQRLQGHVEKLSDAGGTSINIICNFKDDCSRLGTSYTEIFRKKGEVQGITRQQLQEVDAARRILQGIWDNIMDDYRADLLGGPITDARHGRMLRRGLTYMELVEPLEAANYAILQCVNDRVGEEAPYLLPLAGTGITMQPATPTQGIPRPNPPTETVKFPAGARPSRFKWLEDQQTLKLTGMKLWIESKGQVAGREVKVFVVNDAAAEALKQHKQWQVSLIRHWTALQEASLGIPSTASSSRTP